MDDTGNKQEKQASNLDTGRELDSGSGALLSAHTTGLHPAVWVLIGLLIAFLTLGSFFLYQQSKKSLDSEVPFVATPTPTSKVPIPSPTSDLSVPTVSEDSSLETIQKELDQTQVSSPDSELNDLDKEAGQL